MIALICLPVLLFSTVGAGAVPHSHQGDDCGDHPHHAESTPSQTGHEYALFSRETDHESGHCCVCENCHDLSLDAMWLVIPQPERGKTLATELPGSLFNDTDAQRQGRFPRPPNHRPAPPLSHLRTVVLLT